MMDRTELTNFRFTLGLALCLVGIACSQILFVGINALELSWLELPFEPITYIEYSGLITIALYLLLVAICAAVKPPRSGLLFVVGSLGFLPTGLLVLFAVAYLLEWPLRWL